jgi:hypothetical protein
VGDAPAGALGAPDELLLLDAALLRGAAGPRGDAFLRHVVQPLEALHEALERGLAVAVLRRGVLRDDHDAGRGMREAERRFGLVHVLAARAARAEDVHLDLALEHVAVERIRRRLQRMARRHGAAITGVWAGQRGL